MWKALAAVTDLIRYCCQFQAQFKGSLDYSNRMQCLVAGAEAGGDPGIESCVPGDGLEAARDVVEVGAARTQVLHRSPGHHLFVHLGAIEAWQPAFGFSIRHCARFLKGPYSINDYHLVQSGDIGEGQLVFCF